MRSLLLVIAQFTCIGVLAFGGSWQLPWWAWALFGAGVLVLFWAALSLGRNFTIMPDPRSANTLSVRGIYRLVRHPMYTAVLMCGAAVAMGAPSLVRSAALAACAAVLVLKVRYEEARLTERHPDYPERMKGVARLLPFVW
jgi:protein-S-isoprenylcysteine O-methyltransferase Ste14